MHTKAMQLNTSSTDTKYTKRQVQTQIDILTNNVFPTL